MAYLHSRDQKSGKEINSFTSLPLKCTLLSLLPIQENKFYCYLKKMDLISIQIVTLPLMVCTDKLDHMDSQMNITTTWIALGLSKARQKKLLKSHLTILMQNLTTYFLFACKLLDFCLILFYTDIKIMLQQFCNLSKLIQFLPKLKILLKGKCFDS